MYVHETCQRKNSNHSSDFFLEFQFSKTCLLNVLFFPRTVDCFSCTLYMYCFSCIQVGFFKRKQLEQLKELKRRTQVRNSNNENNYQNETH